MKFSEDEKRWLALRAAATGLTVPRLLLESAYAAAAGSVRETIIVRRTLLAEVVAVRRLLVNVTNNLDQLAKAANSGAAVPAAQFDPA